MSDNGVVVVSEGLRRQLTRHPGVVLNCDWRREVSGVLADWWSQTRDHDVTHRSEASINQSINQSSQVMSSQVAFNNKGDTNNEEEKTQYNEEE